jgi:hypothetical protein
MTERPILFSAPMVRAILAGTKTQTRRVQKIEWKPGVNPNFSQLRALPYGSGSFMIHGSEEASYSFRPRFAPGDTLWVREAWAPAVCTGNSWHIADGPGDDARKCTIKFRADADAKGVVGRWRPSIHMPRWASRITLRVTAVKIERLQDISEADAEAEGCEEGYCVVDGIAEGWSAKSDFQRLWTSINGAASWEANPYVAAISFERVK